MPTTAARATSAGPMAAAGVALGGAALIYAVNPNTTHIPLCPLHAMTGLNCPLCGATRATYALLHGDLVTALHDNALYLVSIPFLLVIWLRWWEQSRAGEASRPVVSRRALIVVVTLSVVFMVVRNLPFGAWLSPRA